MQSAHYFLRLINLFGFLTLSLFAVSATRKQELNPQSWRGRSLPTYGRIAVCVWKTKRSPEKAEASRSQPLLPAESWHSFTHPNPCPAIIPCIFTSSLKLVVILPCNLFITTVRLLQKRSHLHKKTCTHSHHQYNPFSAEVWQLPEA